MKNQPPSLQVIEKEVFRLIAENSSEVITIHDADLQFMYVSKSVQEVFGYSPASYQHLDPMQRVHTEDLPIIAELFFMIDEGHSYFEREYRLKHKDGYFIWVQSITRVLRDDVGKVDKIIVSTRDITKLKEAQMQAVDLVKRLKKRNEQLISSRKEIATYRDALEEEVDRRTQELQQANKLLQQQTKKLTKTINTLNSMRHELVEREKNEAIFSLSAGLAHELNNSLNFVNSGAEIILRSLDHDPREEINVAVTGIREGVQRSVKIIEALRLQSKGGKLVRCNMKEIVEGCVSGVKAQDSVDFQMLVDTEFPSIQSDKVALQIIFLNLIQNAADAVESRGSICITLTKDSKYVRAEIADNGRGISREEMSKICNPFYAGGEIGNGLGLGLYVTNKAIKSMGGHLRFESEAGKGTTVFVSIPITPQVNEVQQEINL